MYVFHSKTPEETKRLARELREMHPNHDLILLSGELGSGKTTFTKGLAMHLGLEERDIKSPTYTLMREYDGLLHVDFYRLEEPDHLLMDQIKIFEGLVVIEWPEIALNLLPKPHLHITIKGEDSTRELHVTENS